MDVDDDDISCGRKLYKKNRTTVSNWRFLAYPLIFYAILMLIVLDTKYGFFKKRTRNLNGAVILGDPLDSRSGKVSNSNLRCLLTHLEQQCIATCQNTTIEVVETDLNSLNYSACPISSLNLVLKGISFVNSSITRGWLAGCPRNVTNLEIYSSPELSDIGNAAFADNPFTNLKFLIMEDTGISILRRNVFFGVRIISLELRFTKPQNLDIEAGVLNPLANSISSLQLSNGVRKPEAMKNLTGTGKNSLEMLKILDLRYNTLEVIADETFIDISSLASLYLSDSRISFVGKRAFSGLGKSLRILTISNNNIQTMDEDVFRGFDITGEIRINGNPWRCNCSLEWMKYFYLKNLNSYFFGGAEPFLCQENEIFVNYTEVTFCPTSSIEFTTPTTGSTTINSSSSTTQNYNETTSTVIASTASINDHNISCEIIHDKLLASWKRRHFRETIDFNRSKVIYDFESKDKTPFYTLNIRNAKPNEVLLWINGHDREKYGCVSDIQHKIELDALEYTQSYFLCLLTDSRAVNPFDCTTLVVPPEWSARTWIANGQKQVVIGGVLTVMLVVILLTIAIGFFIVERPRLVKKFRKYRVNQNFMLEKNAPSLYSTSDGYLIPNMYERIENLTYNSSCCQNRELPPPPPTRTRKFGGHSRLSCGRPGATKKSIGRSMTERTWHKNQPLYRTNRSKSIPCERICPVSQF